MIDIIGHKYIFLALSGLLVLVAVLALVFFGLKQGIDFVGGTQWQIIVAGESVAGDSTEELLKVLPEGASAVYNETNQSYLIRLKELDEAEHQRILTAVKEKLGEVEELSFETIGPAIGRELRQKSLWAFLVVLILISLYIAVAFRRVSYPVRSWKYGLITLITLFHDALIPAGLMALFGYLQGVEIGANFIVAILVVMGFSVHDTIVVFDRIRENLKLSREAGQDFPEVVNQSINQTIARSVNTSLALVLTLMALYFFGPPALGYFILMILAGVLVGTYSSIFVASPLLVLWKR